MSVCLPTSIAVNLHAFSMRRTIWANQTICLICSIFFIRVWQRWSALPLVHICGLVRLIAGPPAKKWLWTKPQKCGPYSIHSFITIVSLSRFHFLLSPSSRKQLEITRAEISKNNTKTMFASNKIDNMCHNYKTVTSDIRYIWRKAE